MPELFLKEEQVDESPAIVGYRIMQIIESRPSKKVSIFDVAEKCKNEPWFSPKTLYLGMMFLFTVGLIEFNQPYIEKNAQN